MEARKYSEELGRLSEALDWAHKELEVERYCLGVDSPTCRAVEVKIDELRGKMAEKVR